MHRTLVFAALLACGTAAGPLGCNSTGPSVQSLETFEKDAKRKLEADLGRRVEIDFSKEGKHVDVTVVLFDDADETDVELAKPKAEEVVRDLLSAARNIKVQAAPKK